MARSLLSGPRPDQQLDAFPAYTLATDDALWRIHQSEVSPWSFSQGASGRFNLPKGCDTGTCYFADTSLAAFLEVFGQISMPAEGDVIKRRLYRASLMKPRCLADLCHRAVRRFGINGEVHTITDYDIPQAWAQAIHAAGFDGIRYRVRSDPSLRSTGFALFGPRGPGKPPTWATGSSAPIDDDLMDAAEAHGITVMPPMT